MYILPLVSHSFERFAFFSLHETYAAELYILISGIIRRRDYSIICTLTHISIGAGDPVHHVADNADRGIGPTSA
jgi:hypothetical protein